MGFDSPDDYDKYVTPPEYPTEDEVLMAFMFALQSGGVARQDDQYETAKEAIQRELTARKKSDSGRLEHRKRVLKEMLNANEKAQIDQRRGKDSMEALQKLQIMFYHLRGWAARPEEALNYLETGSPKSPDQE